MVIAIDYARFPYDRYDRCDRCDQWEKKVQRSYGNHSPAIAVTTIAEIELFISQRLLSLRSLESGFIWSLRSLKFFFFFLSDRSYPSDGGDIWKPGFYLIMAYFKRKDCFQRNLYLNCVSLWKSLKGEWYRMVRLNKCSNLVECVDFSDLSGATVGFV